VDFKNTYDEVALGAALGTFGYQPIICSNITFIFSRTVSHFPVNPFSDFPSPGFISSALQPSSLFQIKLQIKGERNKITMKLIKQSHSNEIPILESP